MNNRPAKVAKVGRRYPDRDPLRGALWRRNLKHLARGLLIVLAFSMVSALTLALISRYAAAPIQLNNS